MVSTKRNAHRVRFLSSCLLIRILFWHFLGVISVFSFLALRFSVHICNNVLLYLFFSENKLLSSLSMFESSSKWVVKDWYSCFTSTDFQNLLIDFRKRCGFNQWIHRHGSFSFSVGFSGFTHIERLVTIKLTQWISFDPCSIKLFM